ncbi:efflux transporter outer membrane subunit [Candidatus Magnetaquicoccus inordinatus]|uniref:efflux transporter outer membrane subunit n=1 Tax=Candidatus Magnetaquicoccus inordinatus TaxID=2496818 RepID=UPI00187D2775|nr:TolC family protein [Candidatus Magnetaquicoccus inordinatus]
MLPAHLLHALLLGTVLLLNGCSGSSHLLPALPTSNQFRHAPEDPSLTAAASEWWQLFADPRLVQLLQRTATANSDVRIAVQRLRQARQGVIANSAALWPALDLHAAHSDARTGLPNSIKQGGMPDLQRQQIALSAQWELDLFGGRQAAVQAAEEDEAAARYGVAGAQLLAISETARHYLRWHALQERLQLLQQLLANQQEQRDRLHSQLREGLVSEREFQLAEAELSNLAALLPALHSQAALSEQRMALLSGSDPSVPLPEIEYSPPFPLQQLPEFSPGQPAALLQRRPDLLAAERELAAASARWQEARSQIFPKILLSALFGRQALTINHTLQPATSPFSTVAASFTLPLLHAGAIQANSEAHSAREQELWLEYEKKLHQAIEEVENLLLALRNNKQSVQHYQATLQARQQVQERAASLLREGQSGLLPYLEAQRGLLNAALNMNESKMQQAMLTVQLFTALGGGWQNLPQPHDMASTSQELQP